MKRFFFSFVFFMVSTIFLYGQEKVTMDPVLLGPILIDQPNVGKMGEICKAYNLEKKPERDGFVVYCNSNGTEILFKLDTVYSKKLPTVIVTTDESKKVVDKLLRATGYKKEGSCYVKGSKFEHRRTKCTLTGSKRQTLTFQKEYNF